MTIKSQDELPQSGRDNSTLIEVISKLETTTKQLRIATLCLSRITNYAPACFRTEECPLEDGDGFDNGCFRCGYATAWEALNKIKELEK